MIKFINLNNMLVNFLNITNTLLTLFQLININYILKNSKKYFFIYFEFYCGSFGFKIMEFVN